MPFSILFLILSTAANVGFFLPDLGAAGEQAASIPYADKMVHVGIFALTTWALLRTFALRFPRASKPVGAAEDTLSSPSGEARRSVLNVRPAIIIVAALVAWACGIEVIQSALPERSADFKDVIADAIGIVLGVGFTVIELRLLAPRYRGMEGR